MPLTPAGWRRLHASTRLAAVLGAFGALMLFAPLAYALLMLRSSGSSHGAEPGAWVVIGILVVLCAVAAGAMTGLLVAAIRHLWIRTRTP